ncbi:MAG: hypothetical protein IKC63_02030 [Clostridia bacterium]|nr:hypothetical protein [Clostridia bacterium]
MKHNRVKLLWITVAIVLLVLTLISCGENNADGETSEETTEHPVPIATVLDEIGLGADFSQSDLHTLLERATYEGKSLFDQGMWLNADDVLGGGASFHFENVLYAKNWYQRRENEAYADYTNLLILNTEVEGIAVPCGIEFDDGIAKVLKKLGFRLDLDDFSSDQGTPGIMTLSSEDADGVTRSYTLTKVSLMPEGPSKPKDMQYILSYTELYDAPYGTSTQKITRGMRLYFDLKKAELVEIRLYCDAVLPVGR